jgi:hypothetical protein
MEPFGLQYRGRLAALVGDEVACARDLRGAAALFRDIGCEERARQIEEDAEWPGVAPHGNDERH